MESTSSTAEASKPKRPAADRPSGGCDDPPVTKRPRTATTPVAIDAAALVMAHKKIAELEATVIGAKAREAAQGQRIAALEADNAWLRKRQRLPEPPAALQQLVQALGMREPDLRDLVFKMACIPRYLARCAQDLPPNPAGGLGTFAVTVPTGTTEMGGSAFSGCTSLSEIAPARHGQGDSHRHGQGTRALNQQPP